MIKAFPVIASPKLTLLPGELSTRTSRLGILSPTLMKARDELWKVREVREPREPLRANRRRARVEAMLKLAQLRSVDRPKVFVRNVVSKKVGVPNRVLHLLHCDSPAQADLSPHHINPTTSTCLQRNCLLTKKSAIFFLDYLLLFSPPSTKSL
jgi:hypothetical protein